MNSLSVWFSGLLGQILTSFINIDSNNDGKVQGSEVSEAVSETIAQAFQALPQGFNFQEARVELSDPVHRAKAAEAFKIQFDLDDDRAEMLVETGYAFALQLIAVKESLPETPVIEGETTDSTPSTKS